MSEDPFRRLEELVGLTPMEEEIRCLNIKLRDVADKVSGLDDAEGGDEEKRLIYLVLREECVGVQDELGRAMEIYQDRNKHEVYVKDQLCGIEERCRKLKLEMTSLVPSWLVPLAPIASEEIRNDFSHHADYLYGYIQYLMCLNGRFSERFGKYTCQLYGIRNDLEHAVAGYRRDVYGENFWECCLSARNKLKKFELKFSDVVEGYAIRNRKEGDVTKEDSVEDKGPESEDV